MKRKLFTLLAAISLLLCVATAILWARSRHEGISFGYSVSTGAHTGYLHALVYSQYDRIHLLFHDRRPRVETGTVGGWDFVVYSPDDNSWAPPDEDSRFRWFSFQKSGYDDDPADDVGIPYWAVMTLTMIVPCWGAMSIGRAVWTRRFEDGHCPACGYDLRATPERCPECGLVPKATP